MFNLFEIKEEEPQLITRQLLNEWKKDLASPWHTMVALMNTELPSPVDIKTSDERIKHIFEESGIDAFTESQIIGEKGSPDYLRLLWDVDYDFEVETKNGWSGSEEFDIYVDSEKIATIVAENFVIPRLSCMGSRIELKAKNGGRIRRRGFMVSIDDHNMFANSRFLLNIDDKRYLEMYYYLQSKKYK